MASVRLAQRKTVRRTKAESEQTRQRILRAARREFALHGVGRTSLERVAAAAGVTRGAIYWHFANKRALFRAMREQVTLPLFDHAELPGAGDADPLAGIAHFLNKVLEQCASDLPTRQTFDILSLKCEYVDDFRPELKRHVGRCRDLKTRIAGVYRRAVDAGVMRSDVDTDDAALATCVFITGLLRLWLMDRDATLVRSSVEALIAAHIAALRA